MTALLWAADMGHLQVLELLLHSGADMTLVDDNGLTALLWAADRGHADCVKALLDAGIDVNAADTVSACERQLDTCIFCWCGFVYLFSQLTWFISLLF